ncbi:Histidine phosphatase superfamily clade-2 [Penicillium odoratum]|uniref:Histidine phosphatase superfamily clade-2 n=1 Tax=Penicillium odoratum TaxID=1167516 RepID=UPI00254842DF|nr:Histidine phosphatase superfamily clade-2 [Penicillium odoratum]KAJ5778135.1 Histidine phosphatase superfamily clade-2 [Penicillium odoratum]
MAGHKNQYVSPEEESLLGDRSEPIPHKSSSPTWRRLRIIGLVAAPLSVLALALFYLTNGYEPSSKNVVHKNPDQPLVVSYRSRKEAVHPRHACNSVDDGYECFSDLSHRWGQYSPYFSLAAEGISGDVPQQCDVTFVQVLSRHGARYPTASMSKSYAALIEAIQANATAYKDNTAFLSSYNYTLGSDDLTTFGQSEMTNSGIKFYERYEALARDNIPFMRSSGSSRVIESGEYFIKGFQQTKLQDKKALQSQSSPTINVVISEDTGSNNTLNHNTCPAFEASTIGDDATNNYTAIFAPSIRARLQSHLPGVSLTLDQVTDLMDMCSYDTLSNTDDGSTVSPFCALFTDSEWTEYNYLQSLSKYYGYGAGNPLGPTQGVGFVNELIARITRTPVQDHTSTNHTLDNGSNAATTFPLNRTLYADFTHDNGMIPIFFALGLYNATAPLPTTHVQSDSAADGFSAAWTVPFAARAYVEVMECGTEKEEFVRVLVNDRVVPLQGCGVDKLGRCKKEEFIDALSFAKEGGDWASCY